VKKRELRELQDALRLGKAPRATYEAPPKTVITLQMPDGTTIGIQASHVTLELERDFTDVTSWAASGRKTYQVGPKTFTIKGTM
jgi:hypothetical protein